jgi:uncharacterized membrane protein YhhN
LTGVAGALLVVAALAATGDWAAVAAGNKRLEYVCKPAVLVALTAAALALDPDDPTVRAWFVVALVFSLAGDVFLMLPGDLFVAGLAAFLVGHLAYVGGFLAAGVSAPAVLAGLAVVAVALLLVGRPLLAGARRKEPAMVVPVAAYMAVISAMLVTAIGAGPGLAVAGAALFYTSDALIGLGRFVRAWPWSPLAVIVTYHLGQGLLVVSLA